MPRITDRTLNTRFLISTACISISMTRRLYPWQSKLVLETQGVTIRFFGLLFLRISVKYKHGPKPRRPQ